MFIVGESVLEDTEASESQSERDRGRKREGWMDVFLDDGGLGASGVGRPRGHLEAKAPGRFGMAPSRPPPRCQCYDVYFSTVFSHNKSTASSRVAGLIKEA